MTVSRYNSTPLLRDDKTSQVRYGTFDFPAILKGYKTIDWFGQETPVEYTWSSSDRIDKLANKFYGDDQYWWVISLANNISYPLNIEVGTVLRIPQDVNKILQRLGLK